MYSHVDRMVIVGCMPVNEAVSIERGIDVWKSFGTHYFLERREIGIFNIGGNGTIQVDDVACKLGDKDCLYITRGAREVWFTGEDPAAPAKFYMVSAPAHCSYENRLIKIEDAAKKSAGLRRHPISGVSISLFAPMC